MLEYVMVSSGQNNGTGLPADADPWVIVNDPTLEDQVKLQRLHDLEYLVRQVQVATEEGMQGDTVLPSLHDVLAAIASLGPRVEPLHLPTKM